MFLGRVVGSVACGLFLRQNRQLRREEVAYLPSYDLELDFELDCELDFELDFRVGFSS